MCMKSLGHLSKFSYLFFFIWGILSQSWTEIEDSILVVGYMCGALVVFVAIFWGRNFFRNQTWQLWTQPLKFWKPHQKNKRTLKKLLQNTVINRILMSLVHFSCTFMGDCSFSSIALYGQQHHHCVAECFEFLIWTDDFLEGASQKCYFVDQPVERIDNSKKRNLLYYWFITNIWVWKTAKSFRSACFASFGWRILIQRTFCTLDSKNVQRNRYNLVLSISFF